MNIYAPFIGCFILVVALLLEGWGAWVCARPMWTDFRDKTNESGYRQATLGCLVAIALGYIGFATWQVKLFLPFIIRITW